MISSCTFRSLTSCKCLKKTNHGVKISHHHTLHELNISFFQTCQNNILPKLSKTHQKFQLQTSTKWRFLAPSPNNSSRCPVPRQFCTARRCKSNCCCQCCHSDSGPAARTWNSARFQDLLARFQVGFNGYFGLDQVIFGKINKKHLTWIKVQWKMGVIPIVVTLHVYDHFPQISKWEGKSSKPKMTQT